MIGWGERILVNKRQNICENKINPTRAIDIKLE
jgi:hypothetical protein